MPSALFNDNFNIADENPLSNGGKWIGYGGSYFNFEVVSNKIRATSTSNDNFMHYWQLPGADQWCKAKIATMTTTTDFVRIAAECRMAAPGTFTCYDAGAYINGTNPTEIDEVTAGAFATLASGSTTWAANDNVVQAIRGAIINMYKNGGVPVLSTTDPTLTSGRIGLLAYHEVTPANVELDDFTGGTLPITFVNAGTEGGAASGNCTPGTPASILAGDILVVATHSNDQVAHTMGTGWTEAVQGNGGSTTSRLSVFWHRYNGVSVPSALVTHSAGNGIISGMAAFRGCKRGGSPFNVIGTIAGGTGATIAHNGISPTVDACLLLAINGACDDNNRTLLSGWTNVFEDTGAGTNNAFLGTLDSLSTRDESISMFYIDTFIGSTGTVNVTQAAADPCAGVLLALEPDTQGFQVAPILQAVKRAGFF